MNITDFVSDMLKDATKEQLNYIIVYGILPYDMDMFEALENEFVLQAKEKLNRN